MKLEFVIQLLYGNGAGHASTRVTNKQIIKNPFNLYRFKESDSGIAIYIYI